MAHYFVGKCPVCHKITRRRLVPPGYLVYKGLLIPKSVKRQS